MPLALAPRGSVIEVSDTTFNQSVINVPPITTGYYLSADQAKGGGDIPLTRRSRFRGGGPPGTPDGPRKNPDIHYEAVCAAGKWEVDAAWPHVTALVTSREADKLLLLAIEAVAGIRPQEVAEILNDLADSDDEDIAEAVFEATAMAEGRSDKEDENDEDNGLRR